MLKVINTLFIPINIIPIRQIHLTCTEDYSEHNVYVICLCQGSNPDRTSESHPGSCKRSGERAYLITQRYRVQFPLTARTFLE